jgi:hypothetical protein
VLADQNKDDEAWAVVDTVDDAAAPDDLSAQFLRRIVRAELLARRGDAARADRLSDEAVHITASTDWLTDRAEVLMARGRILRAANRHGEASRAFAKAFELFTRKGNVVSAERVRAVIDERPTRRDGAERQRFRMQSHDRAVPESRRNR